MTKAKLNQIRPQLSAIQKIPKPSKLLRAMFFKKIPPIGISVILVICAVSVGLITPQIFAELPRVMDPPIVVTTSSQVVSNSQREEEFNPCQTDEAVYNSEIEYAKAVEQDAERRFYSNLVRGNERIVEAVYTYATDLNKDLVFALLLNESNGKPNALNKNLDPISGEVVSIDRGLFQLNSLSYPNLTEEEVYQIETNVKYGIAHIRGALHRRGGNVREALWEYNAGANRSVPPSKTIKYAKDIIANTRAIKQGREAYIKDNLSKYLAVSVASVER